MSLLPSTLRVSHCRTWPHGDDILSFAPPLCLWKKMHPRGAGGRHGTNHNAQANLYGDGALHGDPFSPSVQSTHPGPQYLGRGPPPGVASGSNIRATSLNTPVPPGRRNNGARTTSLNVLGGGPANTFAFNHATPTPSNRYPGPLAQSYATEQRPGMDQLIDMLQAVLNGNAEMKAGLSSVDARLASVEFAFAQLAPSR
ncbi:hypothetical protein MVEN_02509300 [Mycena venus]|uniref:Uncharacterized protein n=1 Tax=Mycena venus TaxID=2733690 RepID=A0A8H6U490_9AGAR|nr:hypothetical protein MVEN_02509300 [Mycena venus]